MNIQSTKKFYISACAVLFLLRHPLATPVAGVFDFGIRQILTFLLQVFLQLFYLIQQRTIGQLILLVSVFEYQTRKKL